ncbi:hypothetical protein LguiA_020172 [Lonicera macranthoides]
MGDEFELKKKVTLCGWSWEENKLFELALAVVEEADPRRWEVVAAMVGGRKSAEDVQRHYVILLQDLQFIESGQLDRHLNSAQPFDSSSSSTPTPIHSICWTDEDHRYLYLYIYIFDSLYIYSLSHTRKL